MKKLMSLLAVAGVIAWLSGAAWAGKPKWSADLADIRNGDAPVSVFQNCGSKGSVKLVGSKITLKASKTTDTTTSDDTACNGDEYICILDAYAHSGPMYYNTQTHFRAKAKNGTISAKFDTCPTGTDPSCPPTTMGIVAQKVRCFNPGEYKWCVNTTTPPGSHLLCHVDGDCVSPETCVDVAADITPPGFGTCEGVYVYSGIAPDPDTGLAFQSGVVQGQQFCP